MINISVGIVFYIRLSGDGGVTFFPLSQLRQFDLLIDPANVFYGIVQLVGKFQTLNQW